MDSGDEALEVVYEEGIEYPEHPTKPAPPQLLDNDGSPAMKAYIEDMQKYNTPPKKPSPKTASKTVAKKVDLGGWSWVFLAAGGVLAAFGFMRLFRWVRGAEKVVVDPVVNSALPDVLVVE